MAAECSEGLCRGERKGQAPLKAKAVVRWEDDSDGEENSELSLCLVGKLWTTRRFNSNAFMNLMTKIWSPRKGLVAKEIETNLFLFQFYHWKDLDRVIDGEPWFFDKNVVVLKRVDSASRPSELAETLTYAPFWVRIYDCPLGGRKERRIKALAESIGTLLQIDESCIQGWTKSLRAKVLVDLREPFIDEITLDKDNGHVASLPVKYERLPTICYYCGRVGHVERDCDVKDEDGEGGNTYGFGEWMRASPWKPSKVESPATDKNPATARRLVLRPIHTQQEEQIPSVDQVAETLLKVCVEGQDTNQKDMNGGRDIEDGSGEGEMEQRTDIQETGLNTPNMACKSKGVWHRFKRASEGGVGCDSLAISTGGKRHLSDAAIVDTRTIKKLKQGSEYRGESTLLLAEAAEQPRGSP